MSHKLPAFQFYPGDWRKDTGVQSLDYQARGVWFEILCLMHESSNRGVLTLNGQAMPESALARLLGIDEVLLNQILTTLVNHGVTSRDPQTGALMSRRMVRDEELRKIRQDAGKQGGNPVLVKQKPTTPVKQKPTPSVSSSSSSSPSGESSIPPAPPSGDEEGGKPTKAELAEKIYQAYPKKAGKAEALKHISNALKTVPPEHLLERTVAYSKAVAAWPESEKQFVPDPERWFRKGRWEDDPDTWIKKDATNGNNRPPAPAPDAPW